MAQSQKLDLSGWEGKMNSVLITAARRQREHLCLWALPLSSYIPPGLHGDITHTQEGSPPLLLMGSPSQTHSEACFRNLLGRSQCSQADRQD